jgi:hypothetical protein
MMFFYLITVSITDVGTAFFAGLLNNIFGFIMFRNFQTKFSIGFSFFYAALIGISLAVILEKLQSVKLKRVFLILLSLPFLMPALPLLKGDLVGRSPGKLFYEYTCVELPASHLEALNTMKQDKQITRVLVFPLARYLFMTVKAKDNAYYLGMPYIKPLILKDSIEGFTSFTTPNYPEMPNIAYKVFDEKDYEEFLRLCELFNIKYIYSYNEVAPEAAQMFLYKYSYLDKIRTDFYKELDDYKIEDFNDITLFKKDDFIDNHINASSVAIKTDTINWLWPILYKGNIDNLDDKAILDIR